MFTKVIVPVEEINWEKYEKQIGNPKHFLEPERFSMLKMHKLVIDYNILINLE